MCTAARVLVIDYEQVAVIILYWAGGRGFEGIDNSPPSVNSTVIESKRHDIDKFVPLLYS